MEIKTIVLSVIALRNLLIEIQQEISQVQKYGAGAAKHANDKFSEIITGYDKFLDDLKTGFLAEVQSTGVTPHQFIVKYGICDYTKDGGGISGINVENFSFKKQKELFVGKRKGEIIRSFGSLQIAIFKSVQSKQKVLKFQFPWPKWVEKNELDSWLSLYQESHMYSMITGAPCEFGLNKSKEYATKIPDIRLFIGKEYGSFDENAPFQEPLSKTLTTKSYGWKRKESFLVLESNFIVEFLNDVLLKSLLPE